MTQQVIRVHFARGQQRHAADGLKLNDIARIGLSVQPWGTLCQYLLQLVNLVTGNLDREGGALPNEPAIPITGPGTALLRSAHPGPALAVTAVAGVSQRRDHPAYSDA